MRLLALALVLAGGCSLLTRTDTGNLDPDGGADEDGGQEMDTGLPPPGTADDCDEPGTLVNGAEVTNDTRLLQDDFDLSCTMDSTGAPDAVYTLELGAPSTVFLDTLQSDFDTVIEIRGECGEEDSTVACANNANPDGTTRIVMRSLPAGSYSVIVDGDGSDRQGLLVLRSRFVPAIPQSLCGDPIDMTGGGAVFGELGPAMTDAQQGSCGGAGGPDEAFRFTLTRNTRFLARTVGSATDTILYLRRARCGSPDLGNEIDCDDNSGGGNAAEIRVDLMPGDYHLILDGAPGASGAYRLVTFFEPF